MKSNSPSLPANTSLPVKVIGVGGAGGNIVQRMHQEKFQPAGLSIFHTNQRMLSAWSVKDKHLLGDSRLHGVGAGGDPELAKAAAQEDLDLLEKECEGAGLVFVVTGLGGGTGTGVAPLLARSARECGALALALVSFPFDFEGARRQAQAMAGLQQLKTAADGVICLPHQKLCKLLDEKTTLFETFRVADGLVIQGIRGISHMLSRQGLINVDFSDLCAVLRGRHSESFFATAQAEGEGRVRQVLDQLFTSPLLDEGNALSEADSLLVSVMAGPDLSLSEVNRLMEQINRHCENAHLMMGAAVADAFAGKLEITLIASQRQPEAESAPAEESAARESSPPSLGFEEVPRAKLKSPRKRFVAPPPATTPENTQRLLANGSVKVKRPVSRWRQGQLPLEIISKGRFDKSEPTIHQGEDLDVPTYIRRGIVLN
jgi:cell division protein FtsZ